MVGVYHRCVAPVGHVVGVAVGVCENLIDRACILSDEARGHFIDLAARTWADVQEYAQRGWRHVVDAVPIVGQYLDRIPPLIKSGWGVAKRATKVTCMCAAVMFAAFCLHLAHSPGVFNVFEYIPVGLPSSLSLMFATVLGILMAYTLRTVTGSWEDTWFLSCMVWLLSFSISRSFTGLGLLIFAHHMIFKVISLIW